MSASRRRWFALVALTAAAAAGVGAAVAYGSSATAAGATPSTTTVTSSDNPGVIGVAVTYTATVAPSSATGSVAFKDGTTTIAACAARPITTGRATCDQTYGATDVGTHHIAGVYSGDATFSASTGTMTEQIGNRRDMFNFTGGAQTWTVPAGVTSANFNVYGAQGGDWGLAPYIATLGGRGGQAKADLTVTPGQALQITVGGKGGNGGVTGGAGPGFNGGGRGSGEESGGGGASDVRASSYTLADRLIVAGGGGGGGFRDGGGDGGGVNGNRGGGNCGGPNCSRPGEGGTQTGPGAGGLPNGNAGRLGVGGDGAGGGSAAGGGGYYGGGGGGGHWHDGVGGGGGSGFGPAGVMLRTGGRNGNGLVVVTYTLSRQVDGQLVFGHQPSTTQVGQSVAPAVKVRVEDAYGALTTSAANVSLSIASGPAGGTIGGTTTVAASGGIATFSNVSFTRGGTYALRATENVTGVNSATSQDFIVTVPTATALVSTPPSPSHVGQAVTYTATVTGVAPNPTTQGTVAFKDAGVDIAGCGARPLSGGQATCTAPTYGTTGTHNVSAHYSGDAVFLPSSAQLQQRVDGPVPTTTAVTSSNQPGFVGQPITYTATVTGDPVSPTTEGTVDFKDGGVGVAGCSARPLTGGKATCVVTYSAAGMHSISADYGGNATFIASQGALTEQVDQVPTTLALESSANASVIGEAVRFSATVSGNPSSPTTQGTVNFKDDGVDIAGCSAQPLAGGTAACTAPPYSAVGNHTIVATFSGTATYVGSSATITQVVGNRRDTFTTGGASEWTVPPGVTAATFHAFGGQGGASGAQPGGKGGEAEATFPVHTGEVFQINVGGAGGASSGTNPGGGGANGGAGGGTGFFAGNGGGGGGGGSDVRTSGHALGDRILVAGGGGGAGGSAAGGAAGGPAGANGGGYSPGGGGTATHGGAGGQSYRTQAGSGTAGSGGRGETPYIDPYICYQYTCPPATAGGGGGSGHFGGGGGGDAGSGGGGGSGNGPPGAVLRTGTHSGGGSVLVTYTAVPALQFGQQPTDAGAGQTLTPAVTVRVFDDTGSPAGPTAVTLSIATGPDGATLAGTSTVTSSGGVATFADLSLPRAGHYTLVAAATGRQSATSTAFRIDAGPAATFAVTGIDSPTTAGTVQHMRVAALDSFGNVVSDYVGTIHFSSTDPNAILHPDYTFTAADGGTRGFEVALRTAGSQSVTATDVGSPGVTGSQSGIAVQPARATALVLTFPAQVTRGSSQTLKVTAKDAYGNTVTDYANTVLFSSTDGRANLPPSSKLTNGTGSFRVVLRTRGSETIVASDGAISGSVTVNVV